MTGSSDGSAAAHGAVNAGDVVVADEEGVVVVPAARREEILAAARAGLAEEADETLDAWEEAHRTRVNAILRDEGFEE
ncbi:hypothetical protein [Streptomyces sp. NPDC001292]|uniref:hypothetical protein n=1 Tax=Streptomyces sp. NPDC001292 TaxID=3364558 RepID=UPI00369AC679